MDNYNLFYTESYLRFEKYMERTNKLNHISFKENGNYALFPHIVKNRILYSLRYGGIVTNAEDEEFIGKAKSKVIEYCKEKDIRRIVIRNNPFMKTIKMGKIINKEPFAYIDLRKEESILKKEICKSHKKCIRKAIKERLTSGVTKNINYLKIFYRYYARNLMKRKIIPKNYLYFLELERQLKGNMNYAYVKYKNHILAVSILMKCGENIFMLYGGMNELGYKKHAKHFMIYNLVMKYKIDRYKRLILGTGNNGKDSIYKFKRGFANKDNYIYTYCYESN